MNDLFIGRVCLVRTYSAGVHIGTLVKSEGQEVLIKDSRRVWYWSGAASLSQLAQTGTVNPKGCKFPCKVDEALFTEVIEVIPMTDAAVATIEQVPVWESVPSEWNLETGERAND